MRRSVYIIIIVTTIAAASLLTGCGESAVEPEEVGFALTGTALIEGGGDLSEAVIALYNQPEDSQIDLTLNSYPSVGLPEYAAMTFNPSKMEPLHTAIPEADGSFEFNDLSGGSYIVDVTLTGYGCPNPAFVSLHSNKDAGELQLIEVEEVNGYIDASTTWTSGSVHLITGDVSVLTGFTLAIEGGTLILLEGDYEIEIYGGLNIDATPANPAVFRLLQENYTAGDEWDGILIKPNSNPCEIVGAAIHGASTAIEVRGANTDIRECFIKESDSFGVYFEAGTTGSLIHSILVDGLNGITSSSSGPEFANNLILRMAGHGIEVKNSSLADIHNNVLLDCQIGIFSDFNTEPAITHNLISGGEVGIHAEEGFTATIQYNEFHAQETRGVNFTVGSCYPEAFEYNNFIDISYIIMEVFGGGSLQADTVFAPNNYWDGEDATGIPDRIIDGYDRSSPDNPVGPVVFTPYFTEPYPDAGP